MRVNKIFITFIFIIITSCGFKIANQLEENNDINKSLDKNAPTTYSSPKGPDNLLPCDI